MNTPTALLLNALLDLAAIGAVATVIRTGFRLRHAESAETLHPSQPLPLGLYAHEHGLGDEAERPRLARAA